MIALIFLLVIVALGSAYVFYGRYLERRVDINPQNPTPAHTQEDGMDYVPAADPVLFGHHFSSIAGAGPIVGPVIAGLAFGWLPALLWIVIGSVFVGGTHDFMALVASIRHKGRSVAEICKLYLSPFTYYMFLVFIWFTLIYVLIVFLDLVAGSFAPASAALVSRGGAVASASILYILIAMVFGLTVYRFKVPILKASFVFVPLVFLALWVGTRFPLGADLIPPLMGSAKNTWCVILLVYCFIASVLPVWLLLIGIFLSGITGRAPICYPAFITFHDAQLGFIYPALFITVACGAVSGFHSIVASGTTSKQLDSEKSAKRIAYGSMLIESILAFVALAAVMILTTRPTGKSPIAIFAEGIGTFFGSFGVSPSAAATFGLLAVSTFLLTTLDTCTRLARFIFQELFHFGGLAGRIVGTTASLLIPAIVVFKEIPGPTGTLIPAWKAIWPAFGATNQLMAALALIMVYAWLKHEKRRTLYVLIPTIFMCVTTLTALIDLAVRNLFAKGSVFIGGLSATLFLLASFVIFSTFRSLRALHKTGTDGKDVESEPQLTRVSNR